MAFGAAFLFDSVTEAAFRSLWQAQADAGLPSFMLGVDYPPHITAAGSREGHQAPIPEAVRARLSALAPLPVQWASLGVFPSSEGVVFLSPVISTDLLALHRDVWQLFINHLTAPVPYYRPGQWVPHVTLAFGVAAHQLGAVTELLSRQAWPKGGSIDRLLVGDYRIEGGSRLETIPLMGRR